MTELWTELDILRHVSALWWKNYVLGTVFLNYFKHIFDISALQFIATYEPTYLPILISSAKLILSAVSGSTVCHVFIKVSGHFSVSYNVLNSSYRALFDAASPEQKTIDHSGPILIGTDLIYAV